MNFSIKIIKGKYAGYEKIVKAPEKILIGRDSKCDISIPDRVMSRQHCLIEININSIKLIDLRSRNGTYVNGKKIEEVIITEEDEIRIGHNILQVKKIDIEKYKIGKIKCYKCKKNILSPSEGVKYKDKIYCEFCINEIIKGKAKVSGQLKKNIDNINIYKNITQKDIFLSSQNKPSSLKKMLNEMTVTLPFSQIGNYEIISLIGEGGMGYVYKARHTFLNTIIALKVIKEEFTAEEEIVERFIREAQLGIKLNHPHILKINDAGNFNNIYFIAMEFFEGENLSKIVKQKGPVPYKRAIDWGIQITEALHYAHLQGIIHRDIKPSNILVNKQNFIKVADFGLAKAWQQQQEGGNYGLTQSGQMLGTIQYISPEQLDDPRNVDPQTDIFSLGATLFFILTGHPPFGKEPLGKVIQNILHKDPPPIKTFKIDIPSNVEEVIIKALAKKKEERYKNMEEFKNALLKIKEKIS